MKGIRAFASGIFVVEVGLFSTTYWEFIIKCGSHICAFVQRLQRSSTLAKGNVYLRVENGTMY